MALQEEFESQGNFLFRYRGNLPLIIVFVGIFVFVFEKLYSRALKSPFSCYIIVDLVKHSFYQVNNLYFKFEPKR